MTPHVSHHATLEPEKHLSIVSLKISLLQMQDAIEMGFTLPIIENFTAFFEHIKFGHQICF